MTLKRRNQMAHAKEKNETHDHKADDASAARKAPTEQRKLTRQELEILRRQLQKKFHRS
jgi:hypothetical protein